MMNINQIKAFSWLVSIGLTGGVGYYVYDFQQRQAEWATNYRIPKESALAILQSAVAPESPKFSLVEREAIERSYYYDERNKQLPNLLDWTGAPPVIVIEDDPTDEPDVVVKVESIGDKISILMIYDSQAWVKYVEGSGVTDKSVFVLKVGDELAKPLDYASVKSINGRKGVTFTFDGGEREDETHMAKEYDPGSEIVIAKGAGAGIRPTQPILPRIDRAVYVPDFTVDLGNNQFMIGSSDKEDFAKDFGGIIAREVRHSRHYNTTTRQYDGIELKSVKAGGKIAAHGGQSGDIIKSINGHPVTSSSEAISFVKNNSDKYDKWIVIVENKGKERTMTFESPPED